MPTIWFSRLEHHLVVGVVGDRAAGGERGQPRAAPAAQHAVDRVAMDVARRARPAAGGEALGQHAHHGVEILAREVADTARRARSRCEQLVFGPFARGDFGDDLLREHVERLRPGCAGGRARRGARCRAAPRIRPDRRATAETGGPSACRRRRGRSGRRAAGRSAIERGEPIWQTRSTSPMSMPSSSDAVATSALSSPRFSRCSAASRAPSPCCRGARRRLLAEALGELRARRARPCAAC